jgi:hypothetical protein
MLKSLISRRAGVLITALPLALFVAACGESSTGPGGTFDPEATRQDVESVTSAIDSDELLAGLGLIGNSLGNQLGSPSIVAPSADILPTVDHLRSFALAGGGSAGPIFPSNLLGVTFVYDDQVGDYVPSALPGAPANGVRFMYYAMNPVTEQPVVPLVELGYVDLIDLSTPSSTRLQVLLVDTSGAAAATLVDYFVDGSFTLNGTTLSVTLLADGFISDGTDQLDFVLSESGSFTEGASTFDLTASHVMSVPNQNISLNLNGSATLPLDESATLAAAFAVSISDGENVAVLTLNLTNTSAEGTITYNGVVVIVITGTENSLTFARPDGTELSAEEIQALDDIGKVADDMFEFAEGILEPMGGIFGTS